LYEAGLLLSYYERMLADGVDWPGGRLPDMSGEMKEERPRVARGKLQKTAQAIVDTLREVGPIRDDRGRATGALAERLGDRGISVTASAVAQQLVRLERDGHLERTVKGKLTYAIGAPGSLGDRAGDISGCAVCRRSPGGKCLMHKDGSEPAAVEVPEHPVLSGPHVEMPECNSYVLVSGDRVHPRGACPLHGVISADEAEQEQAAKPQIGDTRPAPTPVIEATGSWSIPLASSGTATALPPFRPPVYEKPAPMVAPPGFLEMAAQWAEDREELLKLRGMVEGLIDELGRTKKQMLDDARTQAELVGNLRAQIALLRGRDVA
jgi:hypothetical protein